MTIKLSNQIFHSFMNNARQGMTSDEARIATAAEYNLTSDQFEQAFRISLQSAA